MTAQPNPFAPHWLIRDIVIGSHIPAAGPGNLLFIGDSIVEGFYWNRIGSLPVINAGYSGIWTEALEPKVPRLVEVARPRLVALLVGTNDAKKGRTESDLDAVATLFERIVEHAEKAGVPFIVMTPPPVEKDKRLTSFYSVDAMGSLSRRIIRIAERHGAGMVDMHGAFADENGEAKAGVTTDGIHLSSQAYRAMHDMLEREVINRAEAGSAEFQGL
ncbi:SGNH/GDSL hydrolase family protein [Microvirga alba]|uniref:SGNH hydrolase-type esterase domain-containing protein n=1 Tax=Microvirga alba TaxID=2791025 RepID=A0A931FMB1_9HYPH|nr:GDSL-type esterase/lipase family protein [Microvirga alba]MBF9232340.1 hypothetical protein [Microvirga alba]